MRKTELQRFRKMLLEEKERVTQSLAQHEKIIKHTDEESGLDMVKAHSNHMADQGTEAQEREKAAAFATKEGRYLYRLEEALRRLYADPKNFGMCHTCGSEVGFERLDALPHARYCIDCKRKEESGG